MALSRRARDEDTMGDTAANFRRARDAGWLADAEWLDLAGQVGLQPTATGLKHRAYDLEECVRRVGAEPFALFKRCVRMTVERVSRLSDESIDDLFAYHPTALERLLGLYANNLTDAYLRLMSSHQPAKDRIAATVTTASIVTNHLLPRFLNVSGVLEPLWHHYTHPGVTKLASYWGAPPEADGALFHVLTKPVLFSLKQDEREVGGSGLAGDDEKPRRSFAVIKALSGLSYLVLTVREGPGSDVHVPEDYCKGREENGGAAAAAGRGTFVICMPCVTFPRASCVNDAVTDAHQRVLGPLGLTPLPVFTRRELETCQIRFHRRNKDAEIEFLGKGGLGHRLAVNPGWSYLTRPGTRFRHPGLIKQWMMAGARLEVSREGAEEPATGSGAFNAAVRKYLTESKELSDLTVEVKGERVALVRDKTIVSKRFAALLLAKQGSPALTDGSRLSVEELYDPPATSKEGAFVHLASAGWDLDAALWMSRRSGSEGDEEDASSRPFADESSGGGGGSSSVWKTSTSQLVTYAAMKSLGLLRADACLLTTRHWPSDVLEGLREDGAACLPSYGLAWTDVARFARGPLRGPLCDSDVTALSGVARLTNANLTLSHGSWSDRARDRLVVFDRGDDESEPLPEAMEPDRSESPSRPAARGPSKKPRGAASEEEEPVAAAVAATVLTSRAKKRKRSVAAETPSSGDRDLAAAVVVSAAATPAKKSKKKPAAAKKTDGEPQPQQQPPPPKTAAELKREAALARRRQVAAAKREAAAAEAVARKEAEVKPVLPSSSKKVSKTSGGSKKGGGGSRKTKKQLEQELSQLQELHRAQQERLERIRSEGNSGNKSSSNADGLKKEMLETMAAVKTIEDEQERNGSLSPETDADAIPVAPFFPSSSSASSPERSSCHSADLFGDEAAAGDEDREEIPTVTTEAFSSFIAVSEQPLDDDRSFQQRLVKQEEAAESRLHQPAGGFAAATHPHHQHHHDDEDESDSELQFFQKKSK